MIKMADADDNAGANPSQEPPGAIALAGPRGAIAARDYDGIGSLAEARWDRQQMATAVEAAKRAGQDVREWLWTAREAERTLGRMILAAREAGDLSEQGQHPVHVDGHDMTTLADLGISRDLAALAVAYAGVPEDIWAGWHVPDEVEPTQGAVGRAARAYADAVASKEARARAARAAADKARAEADAAVRRLRESLADLPDVPSLTGDETSLVGADLALRAAADDDEARPPVDRSVAVVAQVSLVAAMSDLARRVAAHDPVLSDDLFRDANVLAARDAVRRLTDSAACWLRMLNALYQGGHDDGAE